MRIIVNICSSTGKSSLIFFQSIGKIIYFFLSTVNWSFRKPFYFKQIYKQILDIGFYSLPVVGLTTFFSGMVLALQTYSGFENFNNENTVAKIVLTSILRELGPVLAGLMVAGRVGAKMAAEIATMRVSNQIDALETLATRPIQYLIVPRFLAAIMCVPLLVLIGNIIGVFGGFVVASFKLDFSPTIYIVSTLNHINSIDILQGLVKALVFGIIISIISCYFGYNANGGAEGVGRATTISVVTSSVLILTSTYFITAMFI
jgi:phospholipid/cholesterol/gamma-HCH transport system permease protein